MYTTMFLHDRLVEKIREKIEKQNHIKHIVPSRVFLSNSRKFAVFYSGGTRNFGASSMDS
jgi:hypothetical protein